MHFSTKIDPAKLAAKSGRCRPQLKHPHLDTAGKRLIASNGHVMGIFPAIIDDGDVSGPVSGEALKASIKAAGKRTDFATLKCNGALAVENGATFPRPESKTDYPDVDRIIPAAGKHHLSLNAELLATLQKSMGAGGVKLQFATDADGAIDYRAAIRVTPIGGDGEAFGVLMPMRV
jgi:hypothetical protein